MSSPYHPNAFAWDDDAVATLKDMVAADATASEIAAALGSGVSRSAVIGKCDRLKITLGKNRLPVDAGERIERARVARPPRAMPELVAKAPEIKRRMPTVSSLTMLRPAPAAQGEAAAAEYLATPTRKQAFDPAFAPPGARIVTLTELERGDCKWPLFEDGPMLFCGGKVTTFDLAGQPEVYCRHHLAMRNAKVSS